MNAVNEQDWKLFRAKLPGWQKAYITKLNQEYIQILSDEGSAADAFWELEKRIRRDKNRVGVIAEMSRSRMEMNLIGLLNDHAITFDDLDGFSEELVNRLRFFLRSI